MMNNLYTSNTVFINGMVISIKEHVLVMLDKEELNFPYAALSCEHADGCDDYE